MRALIVFFAAILFATYLHAQETANLIRGRVLSANSGQPLEGVEIVILNINERTYSAADGSFELVFPGKSVWISAVYPNHTNWEKHINAPGEYSIYLVNENLRSSQSITRGPFGDNYKYKNASFAYVRQDELTYTAQVSPDLAVQGRLPGLNVKAVSGMPGEGGNFNIRGISSLFAHRNPIVLLDGVPLNTSLLESGVIDGAFYNPLKGIDVNDIASIEIIRDGGPLFGVQGGNGVIMINTIQPTSVETRINIAAQSGLTATPAFLQMMSGTEHKTYLINQLQSTGISYDEMLQQNPWISGNPSYFFYHNHDNNTNWQEEVFRMASVNSLNANLQGGDEIAKFAVMLGYLNHEGVINNSGYQRFSFRFNSDVQILERLSLFSNISFSYHDTDMKYAGIDKALNPITAALLKSPMYAPFLRDQQGNRIALQSNADNFGFSNPATIVTKADSRFNESRMFGNIRLNYELGPKYMISNLFNVSFDNRREKSFVPDYGIVSFNNGAHRNFAKEGTFNLGGYYNETSLQLKDHLNHTHFITAQLGLRFSSQRDNYRRGSVFNTPTDEFRSLSSVTSIANTLLGGYSAISNRSDLFVKSGYRYQDKYLLDVVLNLSATSNAGEDAGAMSMLGGKWGFFPGIYAGWLISSESFLANAMVIDLLKLRASYSMSGNDFYSNYLRYDYISRPYGRNSGLVRSYIPNKTLKWEKINQLNAGIDAALFHNKWLISIDVYSRTTNDLLTYQPLPVVAGYAYYWGNNGSLNATGMDISTHIRPINGKFRLAFGGNINTSNTTVNIPADIILDVPGGQVIIENGSNAFSYYGFMTNGIFRNSIQAQNAGLTNEQGTHFQAGDVHFQDMDNNKIINDADKLSLGDLFPRLTGGTYLDMAYKNISLSIMVDFSYGNKVFNHTRMMTESMSGFGNQSIAALYSWKNEENQTDIPRIMYGDIPGNARFSDRWIENGSFMRLKEVTLAYKLPDAGFYKDLTIYVTGQNLLNSNAYLGYNPEFSYSLNPALQGIDYAQTPLTPIFVAGIKLGL